MAITGTVRLVNTSGLLQELLKTTGDFEFSMYRGIIDYCAQRPTEAANKPGRARYTKIGYSCKFRVGIMFGSNNTRADNNSPRRPSIPSSLHDENTRESEAKRSGDKTR